VDSHERPGFDYTENKPNIFAEAWAMFDIGYFAPIE
jgi:hypothetical protein